MKDKIYVLTNDLEIGYVDYVCDCENCVERGSLELQVKHLNGKNFITSVTIEDVYNHNYILLLSKSLNKVEELRKTVIDSDKILCEILEKNIIDKRKKEIKENEKNE